MLNAAGGATAPSPLHPQNHRSPPRADAPHQKPQLEARRQSTERPTITVVVVSAGPRTGLASCVAALRPQCERARAELVIVRADMPSEVAALSAALPGVRVVGAPEAMRGRALRRLGMTSANSDIVIVTDDAVPFTDHWVDTLRRRTRHLADISDGATEIAHSPPSVWAMYLARPDVAASLLQRA